MLWVHFQQMVLYYILEVKKASYYISKCVYILKIYSFKSWNYESTENHLAAITNCQVESIMKATVSCRPILHGMFFRPKSERQWRTRLFRKSSTKCFIASTMNHCLYTTRTGLGTLAGLKTLYSTYFLPRKSVDRSLHCYSNMHKNTEPTQIKSCLQLVCQVLVQNNKIIEVQDFPNDNADTLR